jgi:hypothetical protein
VHQTIDLQRCTHTACVYSCVPTGIQLYTPAFNVVTFCSTETFPRYKLPIRRERFSTGLIQPAACRCIGSRWGLAHWMGSGSSSASVARYLTDSLSLLMLLVYLNLVHIRLLQYLSTKEIYPKSALNILAKNLSSKRPDFGQNRPYFGQKRLGNGWTY